MPTMKLGVLVNPAGVHPAGWRSAGTPRNAEFDIDNYIRLAKRAEDGRLDLFFLADSPGMRTTPLDAVSLWPYFTNTLEPLTALSAIARETKHIGLAGTVSTSFEMPFNVARMVASLDQISGGRAAWNAVTTASESAARNYGVAPLPPSVERYARAEEFVDIVTKLWATWEVDAFVQDKESSLYFDPDKLHLSSFVGEHFAIEGAALNVGPSAQGRPVLTQAGMSESGRELGARTADVVYASAGTLESAQAFRTDMRSRAVAHGRSPDSLKVLVGISAIVGDTEQDAIERLMALQRLTPEPVARFRVAQDLEADLTGIGFDDQIPLNRVSAESKYFSGSKAAIIEQIRAGKTLGEIANAYARGISAWTGTPGQLADRMAEWFSEKATDGFLLSFQTLPDGMEDFVGRIVPLLQKRGLFRSEYIGTTLRENLAE